MNKVSDDIVVLPSLGIYRPEYGNYGVKIINTISWFHCRELFHSQLVFRFWSKDFYFSHPKTKREDIADFIEQIETKLNVKERTKFYRTNMPTIMYVNPSSFWNNRMRFSLFTIFMRASLLHEKDKLYNEAINKNKYLCDTRRAVEMFLDGQTRYVGWKMFTGWYDVFRYISCCDREKCIHKDRRCRKKLDSILVPSWQIYPICKIVKLWKVIKFSLKKLGRND